MSCPVRFFLGGAALFAAFVTGVMGIGFIAGGVYLIYGAFAGGVTVSFAGTPITGFAAFVTLICVGVIFIGIGALLVLASLVFFVIGVYLIGVGIWECIISPLLATAGAAPSGFLGGAGNQGPPNPFAAFGNITNLFELILLPAEQLAKRAPDAVGLVQCIRSCLCEHLCNDRPPGSGQHGPGEVIIDVGKNLIEDLRSQLAIARQKLEDAMKAGDFAKISYWRKIVADLGEEITRRGG